MLPITRYSVKNTCLTPWVKFIWHVAIQEANINYKLLPTDCIDIILIMSGELVYQADSHRISAPPLHINGLRHKHSYIQQTGDICIFGISFHYFGLYPFVNKSLASIRNKIVDLHEVSSTLAQNLEFAISKGTTTESIVENIENALCFELKIPDGYVSKAELILDYLESANDISLQEFCAEHEVHTKTFLRNVLNYTGCTPKVLRSINRFQKTGNQLVYQQPERVSDVAYDNGFADQAHFIRDFRKFSGATPRTFQQEKITVKENADYTYR